jgi:23S rRNA pseudouridine955/2504/2580 synthase
VTASTPPSPSRTFHRHSRAAELYHGEGLWALGKPARLLSHPNPPARRSAGAVLRADYDFKDEAYLGDAPAGQRRPRVYLIHRLDQDTSGVLLFAFDAGLGALLKELFFRRDVHKRYVALVRGLPRGREGRWRDVLEKRRGKGQVHVVVGRGPPNAETGFRVLERFPGIEASLLELLPETGRTHQLRVQAAAHGHPIAGDERYGDFAWNRRLRQILGLRRMFLHAGTLEFRHPETGRHLKFEAPLDAGLAEPLARLRSLEGRA